MAKLGQYRDALERIDVSKLSRDGVEIFFCRECQGGPGTWLSIWVDDVDAMHQRALAAGCTPLTSPADATWGERYFHVRDPDARRLAYPGLVLRDVTPVLIVEVIAPVCLNRAIGMDEARRLFEALGLRISRLMRAATAIVSSVKRIQSGSLTGASRPFSQRISGVNISGEASASAMAALSTSSHPR